MKDGKGDWYLDMADIARGSDIMIRLAKKDPHVSTKLLAKWKADEGAFQKFFENFKTLNVRKLSNEKLLALYKKYHECFINRFTSSAIIDHFALGTDEHIAKMLREEIGSTKKESDFTEIFSIATAPISQSFINEAEMELLKIAMKFRLRGNDLLIKKYQQKYFWINNNYFAAHVLTVAHFKKEIERWIASGVDLKAKYRQLRNTPRVNREKKVALFKKYKFSKLLLTLLKVSEDFTWWQDERKKSTYLNIHMGTKILGEMARRRGINPALTKYLVPAEVSKWFTAGTPSTSDLRKREQGCFFMATRGAYSILTGDDVQKVRRIMFPDKTNDQVRDIRGLAASVGRVIGRAKIVGSAREVGKVEKGDILVAVMTRPDYIAGIKKAAALVTNEGGITCHAAIVSRELGIPCIIGTKIATEVLKDGDLVEVNANHEVVTVLKRA
ncbi:hypothetical protein HYW17_01265 [Candidatus Uhrbacteria bacterium]|nr:hypothetical protein [Candidatus Uhrbacteria bacterium]